MVTMYLCRQQQNGVYCGNILFSLSDDDLRYISQFTLVHLPVLTAN